MALEIKTKRQGIKSIADKEKMKPFSNEKAVPRAKAVKNALTELRQKGYK